MKKNTLLTLVAISLALSLLKWELLVVSLLSFVLSVACMEMFQVWNFDLLELWVAGIGWVVLLIFIIVQGMFNRRAQRRVGGAAAFLLLVVVVALLAPFLAPLPPNVQADAETSRLLPPFSPMTVAEAPSEFRFQDVRINESTLREANAFLLGRKFIGVDPSQIHGLFVFGTDDVGRDVLSRVLAGSRVSLLIGIGAALAAFVLGTIIGFAAGYSTSIVDSALMRMTDLFLSIPSLFLVIGAMAMLGQSNAALVIVLALTGWMSIARTVRTEVKKLREKEFVHAAQLLGQSPTRILFRHILPNLRHILAAAVVLQFGSAVHAEASLSFLGLGIQPPTASWGNMLGTSLGYLRHGWWLGVFPGLALASVLIAVQTVLAKNEFRT